MLLGSRETLFSAIRENPWIAEKADVRRIHEAVGPKGLKKLLHDRCETGDCAVLDDVAFAKQSAGELWLALKRDGDTWHGFESMPAARIAEEDPARFDALVESMRYATPEQCRRLQYRPLSDRSEFARAAADRGGEARSLPGEAR